ncbi:recombinase family protein [Roseobacter sp.]|uniref:recombinase family protein n=1 Tax=Roseobacter sp. TaxID=1907202 RepID=UPI003297534C
MIRSNRKAVIYCRVSSKGQVSDGNGLESQETRCRQFAESKGYDVVMVFPDTFTGAGSYVQRPGMVALLSFLDAQPDEDFAVIFDDLKRASRDTRAFLDLREAFRMRGVVVECLNFKFEDTPEGEFIETIIAAQGASERKQNQRQVSQKMKACMESGYYVHAAPIGYKYAAVRGRGKMLFPDAPLASIIKEAFEGYASGRFASQAEVTRFFERYPEFPRNKHGRVVQQHTADILTHTAYTGHIHSDHYGIHWLKAHHQAIVSLELFERVQQRRKGVTYAPKRANIGDDFALRGTVVCDCCETSFRSSWTKGATKLYPYYLCQTKGCDAYGKSIPRDTLEGEVGDLIKTLQPTQGLIAVASAIFRQVWDIRRDQAKALRASSKRELTRVEKEINAVLDRIMSASNAAIICPYEDKVEGLERQRAILTEKLGKEVEPKGAFEEKLELALTFLSNPWKVWENGGIYARRLVLKLAFTTPIQYCRNKGARTPVLSLLFKALGGVS